jgi:predicted dehydrogenase
MAKWNAAIIGMGFVGKLHYDALRRLPNVRIRTIVVHKAQDIPLVKELYDADIVTDQWQEAISDPRIQVIHNCTPNHLHDEINLAAIAAGKHIYAEKPMSLTTEGAIQVANAAEAAGIAHAINHQYRMNAAVLEMRGRILRGDAGRPLYVSGCYL